METINEKLKISLTNINDTILSNTLHWTIKPAKIILARPKKTHKNKNLHT